MTKNNWYLPIIISLVIAGLSSLIYQAYSNSLPSFTIPAISLCFFSMLHLGINIILNQKKHTTDLIQLMLGSFVVRLLSASILIFVLLYLFQELSKPILFHVMSHYIIFTGAEIKYLLKLSTKK